MNEFPAVPGDVVEALCIDACVVSAAVELMVEFKVTVTVDFEPKEAIGVEGDFEAEGVLESKMTVKDDVEFVEAVGIERETEVEF